MKRRFSGVSGGYFARIRRIFFDSPKAVLMQPGLIQRLSPDLRGWQRRQLRGLAHSLKPVVQVGHSGVTPQLVEQLNTALYDHELVKVKIVNTCGDDIEDVAVALTEATKSACVQQIGHILVFYKKNPDEPLIQFAKHPADADGDD